MSAEGAAGPTGSATGTAAGAASALPSSSSSVVAPSLAHFVRVLLLVAALVGVSYHLATEYAPRSKGSVPNFTAFAGGIDGYRTQVRPAWRARLASTWFADQVVRSEGTAATGAAAATGAEDAESAADRDNRVAKRIGRWTAAWFAATLVVVLLTFPLAEFCMLGVFAAVVWGYSMPVAGFRVFPWDMPALFFSALAFGLHRRGWRWGLVPVLALGVAFKESVAVWGLVLLAGEGTLRLRVLRTAAALGACAAVRLAIDLAVGGTSVPAAVVAGDRSLLVENLRHLLFLDGGRRRPGGWESPWLVDAGFLLAFLILPGGAAFRPWRAAGAVLVGSLLVFGIVTEYRIYFELAPVAVAGVLSEIAARRSLNATAGSAAT